MKTKSVILERILTSIIGTVSNPPPSLVAAHSAQPRLGLRPADKVATKFYPLSFLLLALLQWQI